MLPNQKMTGFSSMNNIEIIVVSFMFNLLEHTLRVNHEIVKQQNVSN